MPTSWPEASTTGKPLTRLRSRSTTASLNVVSGDTVRTGLVITSLTGTMH